MAAGFVVVAAAARPFAFVLARTNVWQAVNRLLHSRLHSLTARLMLDEARSSWSVQQPTTQEQLYRKTTQWQTDEPWICHRAE